tara:strand:+ start:30786 stop:31046 length:261 start_codon:yes stop_codon:yes gene_type:complete
VTINDLPKPGDRQAINAFALAFNGYEYHGSFQACAQEAKARRRDCIEALRTELFFAQRAANHQGEDWIVAVYAELLPHFTRLLALK